MKKIMFFFVVAAIAFCAVYLFMPKGDSDPSKQDKSNVGDENRQEVTPTDKPVEGEGGGDEGTNQEEGKETILSILVAEDSYRYENQTYDFDGIVALLDTITGKVIVELNDEDATHNAYQRLIDKLTELEISYVEK